MCVVAGQIHSCTGRADCPTGVTTLNVEVAPKRLELMHALSSAATTIALLLNPNNPNAESALKEAQAAARILGGAASCPARPTIEISVANLAQLGAGPLVIGNEQIGALVLVTRSPRSLDGGNSSKPGA
jgi:putative ABC transport system substrate-binding protein